jgi:hypothetical protein
VTTADATILSPASVSDEFPTDGRYEQQVAFLLRFAILAPSTYNTQPWRFRVSCDGVEIFADYTRRMPVADPGGREMLMSIGAAAMNLRVAAAHFGFECEVSHNQSGASEEALATIRLTPGAPQHQVDRALVPLFPFITRRHTNRHAFLLSRIPASVLERASALADGTEAHAITSTDGERNARIADLVARGDRHLMADSAYRRNISAWLHAHAASHVDGLPAQAFGFDGRLAAIAPWATRVLDLGKIRAAHDKNLCLEAPGLIALCSDDSTGHFLAVGELLERILLQLTCDGVHHSYFNMPVQVPKLRAELQRVLGVNVPPQLLLRLGYSLSEPIRTPRRPLEDVVQYP